MSEIDWEFTVGDQGPPLGLTFKDAAGSPLDLTGRTLFADLRNQSTGGTLTVPLTPDADQVANKGLATWSGWTGAEFGSVSTPGNVLTPATDAGGRALGAGVYDIQGWVADAGVHYPDGAAYALGVVRAPLRGRG